MTEPAKTKRTRPDIAGQTFGRLTIGPARAKDSGSNRTWHEAKCSCGQRLVVRRDRVISGHTQSCGCQRRDSARDKCQTHGLSTHPLYRTWVNLRNRCNNAAPIYGGYNGRGISYASSWDNFMNFLADVGPRPSSKHQLDRRDNNGDYTRENCRWVLPCVQQSNKRTNTTLTLDGLTFTMREWADRTGLSYQAIRKRLSLGWSTEKTLTTPVKSFPKRSIDKSTPNPNHHATKHGMSHRVEYAIWRSMRHRCNNPNDRLYGGRGISYSPEWDNFEQFFLDVGPRPSPSFSLERIDTNGDYAAKNCKWATVEEQANNTNHNRRITINGQTLTLSQWAKTTGISRSALSYRVRAGWEDSVLLAPSRRS